MLGLAALLLLALGFYSQQTTGKLSGRTLKVLRENYDSVSFMDRILGALAEEDRALLKDLVRGSEFTSTTAQVVADSAQNIETALRREASNVTIPGEAEALHRLRESYEEYHELITSSPNVASMTPDLRTSYEQSIDQFRLRVRENANAIRKLNQDNMEQVARSTAASAPRYLALGTFAAVLVLCIGGIVLTFRLTRQARELQALRTHFVAIASHELRTPVTSLRMAFDLLAQETVGALSPEQKAIATAGLEDCDRLLALSRQLLDVTKIQTGQLEMHRTAVSVRSLIADAVGALRKAIQDKRITVQMDFKIHEDVTVDADPVKAIWVVTNLLSNALRYTPEGSAVQISARSHAKEVWVSVSDSGPGISPEVARKVFRPFYQAHADATHGEKERGVAGLGLAIAQEIVAAHGGRIWVEPKPFLSRGATITFSLPATTDVA